MPPVGHPTAISRPKNEFLPARATLGEIPLDHPLAVLNDKTFQIERWATDFGYAAVRVPRSLLSRSTRLNRFVKRFSQTKDVEVPEKYIRSTEGTKTFWFFDGGDLRRSEWVRVGH